MSEQCPVFFPTILLIEDDPNLSKTLARILDHFCHQLTSCDSVVTARRYLERDKPTLIIADYKLPDGLLLDLVGLIKSIETVAISAVATPEESFQLAKLSVHQFLSKPFGLEALERALINAHRRLSGQPMLEIQTFGGLRLKKNGDVIRFDRKTPHTLLSLLKAMIALGGVQVPVHRLCDWLWPEDEADIAIGKFQTYLHRLRRIVGPASIVYADRLVSLNDTLVSLDVWVLERRYQHAIEPSARDHEQFLKPWLPGDESSWLIEPRAVLEKKVRAWLKPWEAQRLGFECSVE